MEVTILKGNSWSHNSSRWNVLHLCSPLPRAHKSGAAPGFWPNHEGELNREAVCWATAHNTRGHLWVTACGRLGNIWSSSSPASTPGLTPTLHLQNIRMLHNNQVQSKNQATHVEPHVGEKNNSAWILFLFSKQWMCWVSCWIFDTDRMGGECAAVINICTKGTWECFQKHLNSYHLLNAY